MPAATTVATAAAALAGPAGSGSRPVAAGREQHELVGAELQLETVLDQAAIVDGALAASQPVAQQVALAGRIEAQRFGEGRAEPPLGVGATTVGAGVTEIAVGGGIAVGATVVRSVGCGVEIELGGGVPTVGATDEGVVGGGVEDGSAFPTVGSTDGGVVGPSPSPSFRRRKPSEVPCLMERTTRMANKSMDDAIEWWVKGPVRL